ncbi:hypothetical protein NDU88_001588 [Pleurodeles waltl]|uniref:Uncharacterized protein n=1 Tax=Pleurodeles waltl TaxID=8319 RepID=A0AAV7SAA6_PLEWA|nr:hypothetical protein NDU88_001588 [Pleurodeles waltl]
MATMVEDMDIGAQVPSTEGIPPVDIPKPNPNPRGVGSMETKKPKTYSAATAGTPAPKTNRPKLDPTANAKVNALLKASREEAHCKPEPTRSCTPKGSALKDQKPTGHGPEEAQATTEPTAGSTTVVDPATLPEAAATVEAPHPEGTPEEGGPQDTLPTETHGEPEPMPTAETKEGEETKAPTRVPARAKRKQPKKKEKEDSSWDEEEIEEAWSQVRSQRL